MAKASMRERAELAFAHLARGKGKFGVPDLPAALHMAGDPHVIGRVGEDHVRAFAVHQARVV